MFMTLIESLPKRQLFIKFHLKQNPCSVRDHSIVRKVNLSKEAATSDRRRSGL